MKFDLYRLTLLASAFNVLTSATSTATGTESNEEQQPISISTASSSAARSLVQTGVESFLPKKALLVPGTELQADTDTRRKLDADTCDELFWDNDITANGVDGFGTSPPRYPNIRVVDDFSVTEEVNIVGFKVTTIDDANWDPGTIMTTYIYESDSGSTSPKSGTPLHTRNEDHTRTELVGQTFFGRQVYEYYVTFDSPIAITVSGLYWIGFEMPDATRSGTSYWMTSDGGDGTDNTGWDSPNNGITWNSLDNRFNFAFEIFAEEATPPIQDVATEESICVWPPNHKLYCHDASTFVTATDNCDEASSIVIDYTNTFSCTSNQNPIDGTTGDGNHSPDCFYDAENEQVCFRAERQGPDGPDFEGRSYVVTVEAKDTIGNVATLTRTVIVPHDDEHDDVTSCVPATINDKKKKDKKKNGRKFLRD